MYVRYTEQERSPRDRDYFDYSRSDYERSRRGRSYDGSMELRLVLEISSVEKSYLFKFSLCFVIKTTIIAAGIHGWSEVPDFLTMDFM